MTDKLILALDVDRADEAFALVRLLKPYLSLFKVGNQLFTREGPAFVKALRAEGCEGGRSLEDNADRGRGLRSAGDAVGRGTGQKDLRRSS